MQTEGPGPGESALLSTETPGPVAQSCSPHPSSHPWGWKHIPEVPSRLGRIAWQQAGGRRGPGRWTGRMVDSKHWLYGSTGLDLNSSPTPISCVTLVKSLHLSAPQLPHL